MTPSVIVLTVSSPDPIFLSIKILVPKIEKHVKWSSFQSYLNKACTILWPWVINEFLISGAIWADMTFHQGWYRRLLAQRRFEFDHLSLNHIWRPCSLCLQLGLLTLKLQKISNCLRSCLVDSGQLAAFFALFPTGGVFSLLSHKPKLLL